MMKTTLPLTLILIVGWVCVACTRTEDSTNAALRSALIHYASFDHSTQADFSMGDGVLVHESRDEDAAGKHYEIRPDGGRYGGALDFLRWSRDKAYYRGRDIVNYDAESWQGTVSLWMKISPDEDLEPGWCDPLQIRCDDNRNGFMFLEWSKDETPRFFRYVIRPQYENWNPDGLTWVDMPDAQKPMVQVERAPFSNDRWTHVLFTFAQVNQGEAAVGRLYIDGELQGTLQGLNLDFGWDEADVARLKLALGSYYLGEMDDLAVFNRPLTAPEITRLRELERGVATLF